MSLIFGVIAIGAVYCLIVAFSIQPSDAQVYSRYTAFGEAHFYKERWQYLISFIGFGALVVFAHVVLMIKLHNLGRRQTALMLGYAAIIILIVAASYTLSVVRLG